MVRIEKMKAAVFAAVAACAGIAFAGVGESFESVDVKALPASGWSGDGGVVSATVVVPACGAPISGNHTKALSIDG